MEIPHQGDFFLQHTFVYWWGPIEVHHEQTVPTEVHLRSDKSGKPSRRKVTSCDISVYLYPLGDAASVFVFMFEQLQKSHGIAFICGKN